MNKNQVISALFAASLVSGALVDDVKAPPVFLDEVINRSLITGQFHGFGKGSIMPDKRKARKRRNKRKNKR